MQVLTMAADARQLSISWRQAGKTVALVPTMGNLHAGHLHLIHTAQQHADRVLVSIFVNPTQFGPGEDFAAYPRTEAEDLANLRSIRSDAVFMPAVADMYAPGATTTVSVPGLSDSHCGLARKGHFSGVATVVCKLFNITQPDSAFFGEKDFQQLAVIRRMVADLNIPIEIIGVPTVRDHDGLALSSRNAYLTLQERAVAPALYQALGAAREALLRGETAFKKLEQQQMQFLKRAGLQPEYFSICRSDNLLAADAATTHIVILAAARLGRARLIDNMQVNRP